MFVKVVIFTITSALLFQFIVMQEQLAQSSGLNGPCHYDINCHVEYSYCYQNQVCRCKLGYVDNNTRCFATIGAECERNDECSKTLPNSFCSLNICACNIGFTGRPDALECLPSVQKGDDCILDTQCSQAMGNYSLCLYGKCGCKTNYHPIRIGTCVPNKGLHGSCQNTEECVDDRNATFECRGNQCECPDGFVATNDRTCTDDASRLLQSSIFLMIVYAVGKMI